MQYWFIFPFFADARIFFVLIPYLLLGRVITLTAIVYCNRGVNYGPQQQPVLSVQTHDVIRSNWADKYFILLGSNCIWYLVGYKSTHFLDVTSRSQVEAHRNFGGIYFLCLHSRIFLLYSQLYPENGSNELHRNIGGLLQDYMAVCSHLFTLIPRLRNFLARRWMRYFRNVGSHKI